MYIYGEKIHSLSYNNVELRYDFLGYTNNHIILGDKFSVHLGDANFYGRLREKPVFDFPYIQLNAYILSFFKSSNNFTFPEKNFTLGKSRFGVCGISYKRDMIKNAPPVPILNRVDSSAPMYAVSFPEMILVAKLLEELKEEGRI